MQLVDWLALAIILITAVIGALLGFGKLLKVFTGGVVGVVISVFVTYFSLGVVASWGFVQNIMASLVDSIESSGSGFVRFFALIGIEKILLAIILFFIVQFLRIVIVVLIKGIVEIDRPVMKAINKVAGVLLVMCALIMVVLFIFHLIALIGGSAAAQFKDSLKGGLGLDALFENNPLQYIVKRAVAR